MGKRYKLIISSGTRVKEAELPDEDISIRAGTTVRCDIRIALPAVKEPVEIKLSRQNEQWAIECPDNVYFTMGGVRKLVCRQLEHGDQLSIRLQSTNVDVCRFSFMLDFDSSVQKYDRMIDIRSVSSLVIGGKPNAPLYANDPLLESDFITLSRRQGRLILADFNARYGAYINGARVNGEKELKNTDFFSLAGYSFYYKDGFLFTDASNGLRVTGLPSSFVGIHSGDMEYPKFIRNVRKKIVLSTEPIQILDPPQKPQKPKNNIFMQLLPAIGSIVLIVLLRGVMGGGGTFVIFSACSMSLGAVTTVISFVTGNKDYKKELAEREKEYSAYIARKRKELQDARNTEARQLSQIYLPPKAELKMIREFSGDLFDRQTADEEFMRIRIGSGPQCAKRLTKISQKETITVADDMLRVPGKVAEEFRYIPDAPVCVNGHDDNAIGVVGDPVRQMDMLRIITLDLCSRHYYSDLKLVYILGDGGEKGLEWLRWLPHVTNDALGVRSIANCEDSKNTLFEYMYVELSAREQEKRSRPHVTVFVLDDCGMKSHPMSKYLAAANSLGFTFIFFEAKQDLLPQGCDEVISLERGGNRGKLLQVKDINSVQQFTYSSVSDIDMQEIALTLAPVYSEEISLENSLTKSISMFDMLGIISPDDIDLGGNWNRAAVYRSMAAPLGVKSKNETVYLDLHEKAHGPHGLVAGTTGSGKSELLQSYVISEALLFHPYEVSFVIIDFKGGGMANQFRELPHLVGSITNIDGAAINRSLKSIKAELQKRQRLFSEADVNKIDDYIKLYKKGAVKTPLPHLIIIVDEFAELKAQQPEFMNELISAARIGRSLGVHLILATQKPAGQVNEQIWSNSRFKVCLKVQTKEDSNEVIKSPLAAEIREPGRAYLQVGNNEQFDLFQSAYSGGPVASESISQQKSFSIQEVFFNGKRSAVYAQKASKENGSTVTQLDAIIDYIRDYCQSQCISKLPDICLPDLPEILPYHQSALSSEAQDICSAVGLYDDPDTQFQGPVVINHTSENMLVVGSAQMGKTNLLQVMLRSLAERYSPAEVTIYVLDFGSMALRSFEGMAHVGGVVIATEDERFKNLFKLLYEEMEMRRQRLMQLGVSSFASYKAAGCSDMPQIVLLIDNFTAVRELYLQEEDVLLPVLRDGIAVGISVVIANSQTSGIGFKYMANFSREMALYCNDTNEYSTVMGGRTRITPRMSVGRAIVNVNNGVYEMQNYLSFSGEREIERVNSMRSFVEDINQRYPGQQARQIPAIPSVLDEKVFRERFDAHRKGTYVVPIGLNYDPVQLVSIDLTTMPVLGIMKGGSDRQKNLLSVIFNQLEDNVFSCPSELYVVDDIQHTLKWTRELGITKEYTASAANLVELLDMLYERVSARFDLVVEESMDSIREEPLLTVVVQNSDAVTALSRNPESLKKYKEILNTFRAMKICFIFANLEDAAVSFSGPEILKMIKESRNVIYQDKLGNSKFFDVPMAAVRKYKKELAENDAFYFTQDGLEKLRIVKS